MSKPIPPSPNAIIAALLEVYSAAFNVTQCTEQRMIGDGSGQREHCIDDNQVFERLEKAIAVLDPLVGLFVNSQMNPPDCARELLQSFLVGGSRMTVELPGRAPTREQAEVIRKAIQHSDTPDPLTVGDAVGFEIMPTWNAPTKLHIEPAFKPSAEFPTSGPIHHDFYTHRDSWRKAIQHCIDTSAMPTPESDDAEYWRHELRASDRAFGMLPPEKERRLRPRMTHPTVPNQAQLVLAQNAIEATRPAFERAMQSLKHGVKRHETGLYFGMTEYRWEGWEAAMTSMTSEIRTNMLAETADEALRIINDAEILKNLVELFKMYDPGVSVRIFEQPADSFNAPWRLDIEPSMGRAAASYESTSLHQVIVKAHKGETDREYPEGDTK